MPDEKPIHELTIDSINNTDELHKFFLYLVDTEYDLFYNNGMFKELDVSLPYDKDFRNFGSLLCEKEFWEMILLQHGVFSLYNHLRWYLSQSNHFDLTTFIKYSHIINNDISDTSINCGLDYLIDHKYLELNNEYGKAIIKPTVSLPSNQEFDMNTYRSSYVSALETVNKFLFGKKSYNFVTDPLSNKEYVCNVDSFEFNQYMIKKKAIMSDLLYYYKDSSSSKSFTPADFQRYYLAYFKLIKDIDLDLYSPSSFDKDFYCNLMNSKKTSLENTINESLDLSKNIYFSYSDTFYLRTNIEWLFHFERIDCLFQNITNTLTFFPQYINLEERIPDLVSCAKLPPFPIFNYLLDALFCRLNYSMINNPNLSLVYNTILDRYIDKYNIFIKNLTMDGGILDFSFRLFFDGIYKEIAKVFNLNSEIDTSIKLYEILCNYINSDCNEFINMTPGHGVFNSMRFFPEANSNTTLNEEETYSLLVAIDNLMHNQPGMQFFLDKLKEQMLPKKEPIDSRKNYQELSYADFAFEPFNYSRISEVIRPQKKNLHIYDKCVRETYEYFNPPQPTQ